MEVILKQDVKNLGEKDEIVNPKFEIEIIPLLLQTEL